MKFSSLTAGGLVLLAGMFTVPAISAQFQIAALAMDLSFTISTSQPWSDPGVDMLPGDFL